MKIDIGCGPNKLEGFKGLDQFSFDGKVDIVTDLRQRWPIEDGVVEEVNCSHFLEHLTNFNDKWERVHFFNELYRVMKEGAKAKIVIPHWCSNRYYGDPTHKEPFSEMGFLYLSREWRKANAPHVDSVMAPGPQALSCNFEAPLHYSLNPALVGRNQEYLNDAISWKKEAAQDIIATLVKKA